MKLYKLEGKIASWEECHTIVAAENPEQALSLAKDAFPFTSYTLFTSRAEEICELLPVALHESQPAGVINNTNFYTS